MASLNVDELPEILPAETLTPLTAGSALIELKNGKDGRLSDVGLST